MVIHRTKIEPRHPMLLSADGAAVLLSSAKAGQLRLRLRSASRVLTRLWSPRKCSITLDQKVAVSKWDSRTRVAEVWLPRSPGVMEMVVATE